jgi:hypothetical protein
MVVGEASTFLGLKINFKIDIVGIKMKDLLEKN